MSRFQNGIDGYTNGYHSQISPSRDIEAYQNGGPVRSSREQREGGYGGFQDNTLSIPEDTPPLFSPRTRNHEPEPHNEYWPPRSARGIGAGHSRTASRERNAPTLNGTRRYGDGPGARQIEGVLGHIQDRWDIMTKDDCVPVHVALQLMDDSSLGRGNDYQDFQSTNNNLQTALKAIVNEHHQGFNSSIGTFHKIQSSIQSSQSRVRSLTDSIHHAKSNLMVTNPELKILGASSQKYDDMLQILGQIEKLQLVPEQLDARISDKHFLSAVDILQDALRLIRKSEMEQIGALADLRVYFSNQETSLTDILVEELHDHLYLKSPYCQDRWTPYTPQSSNALELENGPSLMPNSWGRPLYQFLDNLDTSSPMNDDASQNPEADSFNYIHMIIESLNKLGRLEVAVDRIEQRLPIELFALVGKINHEVDVRHPAHLRPVQKAEIGVLDFESIGINGRSDVLNDLLWTLCSKLEAIAEGHRAMHDVIAGIIKREGLRHSNTLTGGFKEMWKLYQSEMRSILHDYLATDGSSFSRAGQTPSAGTNLFQNTMRDKNKRLFKLAEIDKKSAELTTEQEELDQILQTSVPGLVSKSQRRSGVSHNDTSIASDGHVAGHKLLVEPSVFNITLLLPPSLSFLERLKDIVPPHSDIAMSTLTSFLDDFLVNVFHPQLEETVTELCSQSMIELDAFQEDSQWSQHSSQPIFKGTCTFFALIRAFCKMLDTIPQDQAFTQLLISQMVTYYDKCCEWYKVLLTRSQTQEGTRLKTAAAMAEAGDVREVVLQLWESEVPDREDLLLKEIHLLISKTNETPLEPFDIISDRRTVTSLCLLYTSMQWLASRFNQLRYIIQDPSESSHRESVKARQSRRWTLLNDHKLQDETNLVYLPMTPETAIPFDNILASLRSLAITALLTLHIDIRCGIIHMTSQTLQTPYLLLHPTTEPSPQILSLNADLLKFDTKISIHLPTRPKTFLTTGLALLTDHILVANASQIPAMNLNGCGRMQLNILVLQQNLKAIEPEVMLSRSAQFFDLFGEGADAIVGRVKAGEGKEWGFSLEEMKALVGLCFSEGVASSSREVAVAARRGLGDCLMVISECLWDS